MGNGKDREFKEIREIREIREIKEAMVKKSLNSLTSLTSLISLKTPTPKVTQNFWGRIIVSIQIFYNLRAPSEITTE